MLIRGVVKDGHGAAQRDVRSGVYRTVIPDAYPGTLNLEVVDMVGDDLPAPTAIVHHFGWRLFCWKAQTGTVDVIAMFPDRAGQTELELLATCRLRDVCDMRNGDLVSVRLL